MTNKETETEVVAEVRRLINLIKPKDLNPIAFKEELEKIDHIKRVYRCGPNRGKKGFTFGLVINPTLNQKNSWCNLTIEEKRKTRFITMIITKELA